MFRRQDQGHDFQRHRRRRQAAPRPVRIDLVAQACARARDLRIERSERSQRIARVFQHRRIAEVVNHDSSGGALRARRPPGRPSLDELETDQSQCAKPMCFLRLGAPADAEGSAASAGVVAGEAERRNKPGPPGDRRDGDGERMQPVTGALANLSRIP